MRAEHTPPGGARSFVVIGGGIAGLTAALHLLTAVDGAVEVTVLEASDRFGGKLLPGEVAGARVDLGAESLLARRPEALDLAREVGLGDRLVPPATTSASVWTRGALRPMPKGHVMGVPAAPELLAGILSPEGLERARAEDTLPPVDPAELDEDIAVGAYVAARLGREVVDRLVEPLLGGVYAGDAYRLSLRSTMPQLHEAARTRPTLTAAARAIQQRAAENAAPGPVFMGVEGGVGTLPAAVADAVRARGGTLLPATAATALRRTPDGRWEVTAGDRTLTADGVVLAAPAPAAARLLAAESPAAAADVAAVEYASMALVTLAYRRADATLPAGSGFLVPPIDGHTVKASTFASQKWGWIAAETPGLLLVRASVGRHGDTADLAKDDDHLVAAARRDLGAALGLTARPVDTRVTRWHDGIPQYPVGHHARVARVRARLGALPGLAVCGAAYDGVGIPACVAGGRAAAELLLGAPDRTEHLMRNPVQSRHGGAGE
ncbi:protoporphyrinogen oxidase [Streptomyces sp. NPDC002490]|uniref:protoporphyrinogen oxidase n=1 Tax=Streptomyces sp. NPDC002490 TaxID=3154416 RepID=UPI00332AD092